MKPIPARILNAVNTFVGRNDVRYYLNGIHFAATPEGTLRLEATDGHTAIRYDLPDEYAPEWWGANLQCIVQMPDRKLSVKQDVTLESNGGHLSEFVLNDDSRIPVKHIEGRFPDMDRALPDRAVEADVSVAAFNPNYIARAANAMAEIGKAMKVHGRDVLPSPVRITTRGQQAAVFTNVRLPGLSIVVMPLREN